MFPAGVAPQASLAKIFRLFREVFVGAVREPPLPKPSGMGAGICKILSGHDTSYARDDRLKLVRRIAEVIIMERIFLCMVGIYYHFENNLVDATRARGLKWQRERRN
jgi:hypothetical protein